MLKPAANAAATANANGNSNTAAPSALHTSPQQQQPPPPLPPLLSSLSYPTSHAKIEQPGQTPNFIDNEAQPSRATEWIDVRDPATNHVVTRVPHSTDAELRAAVASAERAFPQWRATTLLQRQQFMFRFVALIRQHWERLAAAITLEQGKTLADARGDVLRGLQVAETACGITTQLTGDVLEVSRDMETRSYREPLGVVAAICPFSEDALSLCFFSLPPPPPSLSLSLSPSTISATREP